MKMMTVLLAAAALAPAEGARAGGSGPVAEIVRFRLIDGVSDAAFIEATQAMQPAVEAAPGYVSRRLSRNETGVWTDYVVWSDLDSALTAAKEVFKNPTTAAFAQSIDVKSIEMRHEPIIWQPN